MDDDAPSLATRGYAHQCAGRLAEAVASYRAAVALAPDLGDVWYNLASAYRHLGRVPEAIEAYRQALRLDPDEPAGWNNLGLALRDDGDPEQAIAAFQRALRLAPGSAAAQVNLGNALRDCGRRTAAVEAYLAALGADPSCVPAYFNLHAALYRESDPEPARRALQRALELDPTHEGAHFHRAALELLHRGDDGGALARLPERCDFLVDSCRYVARHRTAATLLCADTFETLAHGLSAARSDGLVVELGVRRGTSIRFLAGLCPDGQTVHGFDAFEGLPTPWGDLPEGSYTTTGALPEVPTQVTLYPGWFADTLPPFVRDHEQPLRLCNVDCDVYESTRVALELLSPRVAPGTVLVFDEYLCNPSWRLDEHRAWREAVRRYGWRYDYLAFSLFTKQAAVRIRSVPGAR
ncbi:MAG: tetratricopeptide repeat protein [Deltaproteobacteria bacterium]|nr:tetratricopeptide repeat protein [Deltaproteobacteria bacterium]